MLETFSYQMPTKIAYGIDLIEDVDKYTAGRKTLLLTSPSFVQRGLVDRIKSFPVDIVGVISEVKSHPEFKDLEEIYRKAKDWDFNVILAIGGGSVLDSAKFLSVYNKNKDYQFVVDLTKGNIPKEGYQITPIICVPTTAGTGSEVTPYSTIWDMDEKKKYSLHLPDLFCEWALYDPNLTLSVPKQITIQTGLDTLSHALESIWNKNANPITIGFAVNSAKLVMENIVDLSGDLKNITYRDNLMKACMYAGLAFSNTQTAVAHAMSYYITTHKGVDHGIACSFTLPLLIDNVIGKYTFIDKALVEIFGELSSAPLRKVLFSLGVSTNFSDHGINDDELEALKSSLQNNIRANNSLVGI